MKLQVLKYLKMTYVTFSNKKKPCWSQGLRYCVALPSQLEEVFTRYLSVFEELEMDVVQGEWVVKRRNYAATLNNRGSTL